MECAQQTKTPVAARRERAREALERRGRCGRVNAKSVYTRDSDEGQSPRISKFKAKLAFRLRPPTPRAHARDLRSEERQACDTLCGTLAATY